MWPPDRDASVEKSREAQLAKLRARKRAQPNRWLVSAETRRLAACASELKRSLTEALGSVQACGQCARGEAGLRGVFDGGRCCATSSLTVFHPVEMLAVTTQAALRRLPVLATKPAGCAFRGPTSCALEPAERPAACHVYLCADLKRELGERPLAQRRRLAELRSALVETMEALSREAGLPPPAPTHLVSW